MIDQDKIEAFRNTELGRLFFLYDAKIANAWIADTFKLVNLGGVTEKAASAIWDNANAAREALLLKMMEIENGK